MLSSKTMMLSTVGEEKVICYRCCLGLGLGLVSVRVRVRVGVGVGCS